MVFWPGPDAGDEAALLLEVVGDVVGLEGDVGGVEVGEEHDQRAEEQHVQRLAAAHVGGDVAHEPESPAVRLRRRRW